MVAPAALKVAVLKAHTVADGGVMFRIGSELVLTPRVVVDTQPELLVPDKVYTLLAVGVKAAVVVVTEPFQV